MTKLQEELWVLCKKIIREKYGNTCYTCGKTNLESSNWHTGHFIPKSVCGAYLKYDLRVLRPQCFSCNIHKGGMGAEYYKRMVEIEGQEYVDQIFRDKNKTVKARDHYEQLLQQYKNMI